MRLALPLVSAFPEFGELLSAYQSIDGFLKVGLNPKLT